MKIVLDQKKLKDPKWLVSKTGASGQKLVFGPRLLPGWVCTFHQAYNYIERERCKFSNCQQRPLFTDLEVADFAYSVRAAGGYMGIRNRESGGSMITEIKEIRTIETKFEAGIVTRTETIVTTAPNEELLKAHLATSARAPWDCKTGPSIMESIFGKAGR